MMLRSGMAMGAQFGTPSSDYAEKTKAFLWCVIPAGEQHGKSSSMGNLSAEQSIAIIDKYYKDRPEKWNLPAYMVLLCCGGCRDKPEAGLQL